MTKPLIALAALAVAFLSTLSVGAQSIVAFTDIFVRRDRRWRLALAHGVELPTPAAEPSKP